MDAAILFDCEFLTAPGAPRRFWCGPGYPDPVVAPAIQYSIQEGRLNPMALADPMRPADP